MFKGKRVKIVDIQWDPSKLLKNNAIGISLVVQWLRLRAPSAGGPHPIHGTRSHMLQLKDPTCSN